MLLKMSWPSTRAFSLRLPVSNSHAYKHHKLAAQIDAVVIDQLLRGLWCSIAVRARLCGKQVAGNHSFNSGASSAKERRLCLAATHDSALPVDQQVRWNGGLRRDRPPEGLLV